MGPDPLDDSVRERMRRQPWRDTKAEMDVRRRLHAAGYRYRVDLRMEPSLRCRGDIVFTRKKVAVFIDGCFWHGCPMHATEPKNNADWWRVKLATNRRRDGRNTQALREAGWRVLRFWEHEDPERIAQEIMDALAGS